MPPRIDLLTKIQHDMLQAQQCVQKGDFTGAETLCRSVLKLAPDHAIAWNNLGLLLEKGNRLEEAATAYENAVQHGATADAYFNLASVEHKMRRNARAESALQKAIALQPTHVKACNNYAILMYQSGNREEGERYARKTIALNPDFVPPYFTLTKYNTYNDPMHEDVRQMEAILTNPSIPEEDAIRLHFALGKIYDDCACYDDAFRHYLRGNELQRRKRPFNQRQHALFLKNIQGYFTEDVFARFREYGHGSRAPVFIVGMPRSGSTLVEQILGMHPQIATVGENPTMVKILQQALPDKSLRHYPRHTDTLTREDAQAMAEQYLTAMLREPDTSEAARIVNKRLGNIVWLGTIALLFPNAFIIHCDRDPMDTCLSCYRMHFTEGNHFTTNLEDTAFMYREYQALMAHWRKVLPCPIHDITYEALLEHPEQETRKLLEFLELPFDDRCLKFHESKKAAQTASAWQVQQPLYTTSQGRWRNYEKHLGPLKEALGMAT